MSKLKRVVIVDIVNRFQKIDEAERNLEEIKSLVATYHVIHVVFVTQHRSNPHTATFTGRVRLKNWSASLIKERSILSLLMP